MSDTDKYVVIAEHKADETIVFETYLSGASREEALTRMENIIRDPKYIRVAVARLVYSDGHKGLLPTDEPQAEKLHF